MLTNRANMRTQRMVAEEDLLSQNPYGYGRANAYNHSFNPRKHVWYYYHLLKHDELGLAEVAGPKQLVAEEGHEGARALRRKLDG
eukprot:1193198-Prorocentrum_minimum.AAC.2